MRDVQLRHGLFNARPVEVSQQRGWPRVSPLMGCCYGGKFSKYKMESLFLFFPIHPYSGSPKL